MVKVVTGEVREIGGEDKAGFVRVRIHKLHDNEKAVKDSDLPWAIPIQGPASASLGRVGNSPNGYRVGSRVVLTADADDPEFKHPFIIGAYARAAPPKDANIQKADTATHKAAALPNVKNGDSPGSVEKIPKNHANVNLGQKPNTEKPKYGQTPVKTQDDGVDANQAARDKYAPKADEKTTAGAEKGMKDLNAAIKATGAVASQVLPGLVSAMSIVSMLMKSNSSSGSQNETTKNALNDALKYLSNRFGVQYVLEEFNRALSGGKFKLLSERNQGLVQESISLLIKDISEAGEGNLTHFEPTPTIIKLDPNRYIPTPVVHIDSVPNLYVQQYFELGSDPCPGYIQWKGPNGDYYYSEKLKTDPSYASAEEHIYDVAFNSLAKIFIPYLNTRTLTVYVIDKALNDCIENIKNTGMNAAMGKGAAQNLMSLLPALLGGLSGAVSFMQGAHLPESVLNVGSMNKTIESYSRAMATAKFMSSTTATAFNVPSALSALSGGIGGISGLAGGLAGGIVGGLGGGITGAIAGSAVGQVTGVLGEAAGISQDGITAISTIAGGVAGYTVAKATTLVNATSSLEKANVNRAKIYAAQSLLWSVL
jgi:hypothetical protein